MTCTNEDRAGFGEEAVQAFIAVCSTDEEDAVADLICDLLHFAAQRGDDALKTARRGISNYVAETLDDDGMMIDPSVTLDVRPAPQPFGWSAKATWDEKETAAKGPGICV